ncbi:hypothetical protein [uncultured Chryseobacterium sp.]|uniref:hypothetical protein n=1 Tax=uncultured Chryseobacterium sp. TaxID=259322 RepID=UPI00262E0DB3|nr:hypothetical protein [uncultured Chryseobacterium sp.]
MTNYIQIFRRWIYLLGGIFFIVLAIKDQTWWLIPFGSYFAAMSIFKFGCASGNCELPLQKNENSQP